MTKARTLANFISDNNEFADGTISVSEVSGAAPLASPSFTGNVGIGVTPATFYGRALHVHDTGTAGANIRLTDSNSGTTGNDGMDIIQINNTSYIINREAGGMNFYTGGELRYTIQGDGTHVFNENSLDNDFRVESDNHTHALFVDASTDRVGIKSNSPASDLEVRNPSAPATFRLVQSGNGTFTATTTNGSTTLNAVDAGASLVFSTADTERMRILSTGDLRTLNDNSTAQSLEFRTGSTAGRGLIKSIDRGDSGSVNPMTQLQLMGTGTNNYIGQFKVVLNGSDSYASTNQQNCADFRGDTGLVLNQSGYANLDFRVESDNNANMIKVDAGENAVGIGVAPAANYRALSVSDGSTDGAIHIHGENAGIYLGTSYTGGFTNNAAIARARVAGYHIQNSQIGDLCIAPERQSDILFGGVDSASGSNYDYVRLEAGGTFNVYRSAVFNENSGDYDFRVESNSNANMLKVDAGNDCVGIGTGSPSSSYGLTVRNAKRAALFFKDSSNDGDIMQEITWDTSGFATRFYVAASGAGANGAATAMYIGRNNSTNRSINASGTINASGSDYAEYMVKADTAGTINKGDVCGIDVNGKLTTVWADAISFVVKSTDPSYVGGDTWFNDEERPNKDEVTAEEYAAFEERLETARATVDRIAFSGQVPVNVTGATVGDYIVPLQDGTGITGQAVSNPTFDQYMAAVGKVIAIEDDGRAKIIVKIA
jgi:hypothetical protein